MTVKFINHRTFSKDGEVMMITLSQKGPSENSKWDFANPGRPLNPYTKFQCHWSERKPDEENSLEGENG